MAFIHCLAHAGDMFRELTGESRPRPSTGNYPGEYWDNAEYTSGSMRCPGIAIWINNSGTTEGHALCVGSYEMNVAKYKCYEAN